MRKNILASLLIVICTYLNAQNNKTIYDAYISGNMIHWKNEMVSIEYKRDKTNKEKLDLVNFQYGYIAWCIDKDKIKEAEKLIDKSEDIINELEKKNYNPSMLAAYQAAIMGSKSLAFAKQDVSATPIMHSLLHNWEILFLIHRNYLAILKPKLYCII